MLLRTTELLGHGVVARDGKAGDVHDCLFDDEDWTVRYVVVETSDWLPGRRVLIPAPRVAVAAESRQLRVELTRHEAEAYPGIASDPPVSRQRAKDEYLGWSAMGVPGIPTAEDPRHREEKREHSGQPRLRSVREVYGYQFQATDREIGHIADFLIDPESWQIRLLEVDPRNWLPEKRVTVAPLWIGEVRWNERKVYASLPRQENKEKPEFAV